MVQPVDTVVGTSPPVMSGSYIHWGAAIAGALVASAVTFVLMGFGAGIGLSLASPSPTWRNASVGLALLSGLWILVVAVGSFALAGYIAGRMRMRLGPASSDEVDFRDGMHGAAAWALAVVLGAILALGAARVLTPTAAETSGSATMAGTSEPRAVAYEVDRLLRGDRRPDGGDMAATRGEIGRLVTAALDERTYTPDDRAYLIRLVAARTGLAAPDAERRVDTVIAQAREKANRARRSAVVTAFIAAAATLLGLAAAWFAAGIGGRHRDGETIPSMSTALRRPTVTMR